MAKKEWKLGEFFLTVWSIDWYYRFSVYRWFDGHQSEKAFMIDCRYYRSKIQKSLTDGSITPMKMRPKVSIDSINRYYRYRSIDTSPIVSIYCCRRKRVCDIIRGGGDSHSVEQPVHHSGFFLSNSLFSAQYMWKTKINKFIIIPF